MESIALQQGKLIQCLAATAISLLAVGYASAQNFTMKISTPTINDINVEWMKTFKAAVEKRTDGKLKVELYPGSQLGSMSQTVDGVMLGTIEAAFVSTGFFVGIEPRYQVFDAVGIFDDLAHGQRIFNDEAIAKRLATFGAGKGIQPLTTFVHSPIIIVSKRPIRSLADLNGMKIRTYPTPLQMVPMKKLGASPLPMSLGEILPALQNGTIDAAVNSQPVVTAYKFYDSAKYSLSLPAWQTVAGAIVNKAWLESLPANYRSIIAAESRIADKYAAQWGADDISKSAKTWEANGGILVHLSPEQDEKFLTDFGAATGPILAGNPKLKEDYEAFVAASAKYR